MKSFPVNFCHVYVGSDLHNICFRKGFVLLLLILEVMYISRVLLEARVIFVRRFCLNAISILPSIQEYRVFKCASCSFLIHVCKGNREYMFILVNLNYEYNNKKAIINANTLPSSNVFH